MHACEPTVTTAMPMELPQQLCMWVCVGAETPSEIWGISPPAPKPNEVCSTDVIQKNVIKQVVWAET